ncbi:hypothetical protein PR003_g17251 [Phytophthora rubi]|uniref:Uncharacterized protein n=1 Tax=Phytophthora rubi TaxID=129364 RepID=A0A6A4EGZ8_9STRA|nr:hypothetical protein PR003_g17251 [Phytophthora rubi]
MMCRPTGLSCVFAAQYPLRAACASQRLPRAARPTFSSKASMFFMGLPVSISRCPANAFLGSTFNSGSLALNSSAWPLNDLKLSVSESL